MLDARGEERSSIPTGIWSRQKAIGSPNTIGSRPPWRRCAAAARPCGPAPTMATGLSIVEVLGLYMRASMAARLAPLHP
jgi:hypothetical protein